ncbi:MAG TPA: ABC transporter permease [Acidobacteriota bacterium]|nr:ABC transporter permease [Acidobacteriota bacterium]
MARFLLRRLGQTVILLLLVSFFVFLLVDAIPGDYLTEMQLNSSIPRERVEELRRDLGLDQPFYIQYATWLGGLLRGDFGYSFAQRRPANQLIAERLGNTLKLAAAAFFLILLLTFPPGIAAALAPGRWIDRLVLAFSMLGLSLPALLLGIAGVYLAFRTGLFPLGGLGGLHHLFLPSLVLALPNSAYLVRQLRLEMLDALKEPHVEAARARGLPPTRVVLHALRSALNPMISLLGVACGALLSGAVVVESIFDWPGLGDLVLESLLNRDLFVVLNSVLLAAVFVVLSNLAADFLLALNDPRIRTR